MSATRAERLITGAWIETAEPDAEPIRDGAVAMGGGRILAVGPTQEILREHGAAAERVDGRGRMVLPGFVDSHLHTAYWNVLRATNKSDWSRHGPLSGGGDIRAFLRLYGRLDRTRMTREESRAGARASLLGALMAGTTCVNEGSIGDPEGIADAAEEIGVRAVVTHANSADLGWTSTTEGPPERIADAEAVLRTAEEAVGRLRTRDPSRIRGWYTLATDLTASDALIRGMFDLARRDGVGVSSHVCTVEDQDRVSVAAHGRRGIERLDAVGALGPAFLGVHMGFMTEAEVARLAATGSRIAHCPGTSMGAGKGILAERVLLRARDAGVLVALGSDTAAAGSLLDQGRLAFFGHKEAWRDDRRLDPRETLRMATLDGARALHWDDEIGSVTPGKRADLLLVDVDTLRHAPFADPLLAFWRVGHPADIRHVLVGGRALVRDGVPLSADPAEVASAAKAASASFLQRLSARA